MKQFCKNAAERKRDGEKLWSNEVGARRRGGDKDKLDIVSIVNVRLRKCVGITIM